MSAMQSTKSLRAKRILASEDSLCALSDYGVIARYEAIFEIVVRIIFRFACIISDIASLCLVPRNISYPPSLELAAIAMDVDVM